MTLTPRFAANLARCDAYDAAHPEPAKPVEPPVSDRKARPVIARQLFGNGLDEPFPSMSAVGRKFDISSQVASVMVMRAIHKGRSYKDRMWRYAEREDGQ